jgi:RNA polymerase sigma factor (sigma-70 family)
MTQAAPSRMLSDAAIARRAAGGNQRAFAAIFERYHQDLYRYCAAILGNAEDAHDAVQNTMLKVLRALPGEERDLKLKPWLYRIAHNEAIDLIRVRRKAEPIDAEMLAGAIGPAEQVETRGRLQQLISDIAELPDSQRGALVMREMSGLSYEQIGEALQTSPAVARQTIYEARLNLRQMSEGREMPCQEVMRAISDDDGRVLRRREIRAHLLRCEDCKAFRAEISDRRREFASLAPLPAAVSAGILQGLLGGAAGGTNAVGGVAGAAAGKALAGSAAVKSAAAVLAVSAVGVVAANHSGVVNLGVGGGHQPPAKAASEPTQESDRSSATAALPDPLTGAVEPRAPLRKGRAESHLGSAVATATDGSRAAPVSSNPAAAQIPQSNGREPGSSKGSGHEKSSGKPDHPAKGKKSATATPPRKSKSPGHTKHAAPAKTGGKAKAKSHPAHPDHPPHPDRAQVAEAPDAAAEPTEAGPAEAEANTDGKKGSPATE